MTYEMRAFPETVERGPAARLALLNELRFPVNEDGSPGEPLISHEDYLRLLDFVTADDPR